MHGGAFRRADMPPQAKGGLAWGMFIRQRLVPLTPAQSLHAIWIEGFPTYGTQPVCHVLLLSSPSLLYDSREPSSFRNAPRDAILGLGRCGKPELNRTLFAQCRTGFDSVRFVFQMCSTRLSAPRSGESPGARCAGFL